jgi:hypothetical protein
MTFEEYLETGGDREEKLVAIYKVEPERLSAGYRGILDAFESGNALIFKPISESFPDIRAALDNWNEGRIPSELRKQGADFV